MKYFSVTLLCLSLAACSSSLVRLYDGAHLAPGQSMRIEVPGELDIISINGQRVSKVNNLFSVTDRTLEVLPGEYRISAFYHNVFELGGDQAETIKTRPALFIIDGAAGDRFRLNFVPPATLDAARAMRENFTGWSSKANGSARRNTVPTDQDYRRFSLSLGGGPSATLTQTVAPYGANTADPVRKDSIERLKTHWQQATPAERQHFLQWIENL